MLYTRFHAIRKRWLQPAGRATQDPSATSEPKQSSTSSSAPSGKNDPNAEVTVEDSGNTSRLRVNLVQALVMRESDATDRRPMQSRLTAKLSFDLRPGKYPVRRVIPHSEGS